MNCIDDLLRLVSLKLVLHYEINVLGYVNLAKLNEKYKKQYEIRKITIKVIFSGMLIFLGLIGLDIYGIRMLPSLTLASCLLFILISSTLGIIALFQHTFRVEKHCLPILIKFRSDVGTLNPQNERVSEYTSESVRGILENLALRILETEIKLDIVRFLPERLTREICAHGQMLLRLNDELDLAITHAKEKFGLSYERRALMSKAQERMDRLTPVVNTRK